MRKKMLTQFISLFYLLTFAEGKEIMPNKKDTGLEYFVHFIHTGRQTFTKLLLEEQLKSDNDISEVSSEVHHSQNTTVINSTAKTLTINSCNKLIALYVRMIENYFNLQDRSIDEINKTINLIGSTDNQTASLLALHLSNLRLGDEIFNTIDEQRKLVAKYYSLSSIVKKRHMELFNQAVKLWVDDNELLFEGATKSNKHLEEFLRLEIIILDANTKSIMMCAEIKDLIALKKTLEYFA